MLDGDQNEDVTPTDGSEVEEAPVAEVAAEEPVEAPAAEVAAEPVVAQAAPPAQPRRFPDQRTGVTMKSLLEAGVHFGHQTRKWHPRMKRYIFAERNGIYIVDLQ